MLAKHGSTGSGVDAELKENVTRRALFRAGLICGGALLTCFDEIAWAKPSLEQEKGALAGGKLLGLMDFADERLVQMDTAFGAELDGRLYTDLSTLNAADTATPTAEFYIRTRASGLLPEAKSWQISVDGLAQQRSRLPIADLKTAAKPMGLHLMECAGNVRQARFGMISVGNWAGVPLTEILDNAKVKPEAARVLISGFDRYVAVSASSIPGASWVFTLEELKDVGAFLATELNDQLLTR